MTNFSINFSNSNFHFNISSNLTCLWLEMLTMLCYERTYTLLMLTQTRQWFLWRVKFTSILKIFICTRSTKYCILLKYHCQFSYNFIISKVVLIHNCIFRQCLTKVSIFYVIYWLYCVIVCTKAEKEAFTCPISSYCRSTQA